MTATGAAERRSPREGTRGRVPPDWASVLGAQSRLLARKQWKLLGLLAAGTALVTFLRFGEAYREQATITVEELLLGSPLYVLACLLAVAWAAGVWSDEGPGERAYHWSLPVVRPVHDLTRVGVGAGFFLIAGLGGLALGGAASLVWGVPLVPGGITSMGLIALGLLLGFLLGTVPALLSGHPLRWAVGVPLGYAVFGGLTAEAADRWSWLQGIEAAVTSVWSGTLGLRAAFLAPHEVTGYAEGPVSSEPLGALLLWLGLAAAAVVALSFLHLERAKGAAE